ncbi:MAG TPA: HNH endonuclease [Candidatus Acidoferrum sp.]|nr:HNH endonuclease [Candidatus Acidoferrum sp.]
MKRNGGDRRGSSEDRRKRKVWMLWKFGDGQSAPCVHCGKGLEFDTMEQDRIIPGGGYNRQNIQPSCRPCNERRGDSPITPYPPR